jgi:exodeoxyribonuclease VII small subunit
MSEVANESNNSEINLTFREAMKELNSIVELLESNTLELEESLVKYERGIALLRYLRSSLNNAQQKVEVLMGELDLSMSDEEVDTNLSKA